MINGVMVNEPDVYTDYRGDYWTTWKGDDFDLVFNHDKVSTSRHGVLRGIHGDNKSWKLVTCLYGEIYFVIVDNRKNSLKSEMVDEINDIADTNYPKFIKALKIDNLTKDVDKLYTGLQYDGMIGGKLMGAGKSGFIFGILKDPRDKELIKKKYVHHVDFDIDEEGSKIIHK